MKRTMFAVGVGAALTLARVAYAQAPIGIDGTAVQVAITQATVAKEKVDAIKQSDLPTKTSRVEDTNTRLLTEILNTQLQTLATLQAIEAKMK